MSKVSEFIDNFKKKITGIKKENEEILRSANIHITNMQTPKGNQPYVFIPNEQQKHVIDNLSAKTSYEKNTMQQENKIALAKKDKNEALENIEKERLAEQESQEQETEAIKKMMEEDMKECAIDIFGKNEFKGVDILTSFEQIETNRKNSYMRNVANNPNDEVNIQEENINYNEPDDFSDFER